MVESMQDCEPGCNNPYNPRNVPAGYGKVLSVFWKELSSGVLSALKADKSRGSRFVGGGGGGGLRKVDFHRSKRS